MPTCGVQGADQAVADLAAQYETQPTYASHYIVLQVNLLSGVAPLSLVVDVVTGKVIGTASSTYGVEFRPDSRLLVTDPIDNPDLVEEVLAGIRVKPAYYEIDEEGRFREIRGES